MKKRYGSYKVNEYNNMGNIQQRERGQYNDFMNIKNTQTEGGYNAEIVGMGGENSLNQILLSLPEYYHVMPDLMFKTKKGTTQLDHVVVSPFGIFVIETKNYKGMLFGDEQGKVWTQTFLNGQKHTVYNPLMQNFGHIKSLCNTLHIHSGYVIGLIALTNPDVNISRLNCRGVFRVEDLYNVIINFEEPILEPKIIERIIKVLDKRNINSYENRQKHKDYVNSFKSIKTQRAFERERDNKEIQRRTGFNRW